MAFAWLWPFSSVTIMAILPSFPNLSYMNRFFHFDESSLQIVLYTKTSQIQWNFGKRSCYECITSMKIKNELQTYLLNMGWWGNHLRVEKDLRWSNVNSFRSVVCRDFRSHRNALFDGIEEGGMRGSVCSSREIHEHKNDQAMDSLHDRISILKRVCSLYLISLWSLLDKLNYRN
jgi:hypothetical protein